MKLTIIRAANHKTSKWSGGSTTQLFIYPQTAEYEKRNFDFRLSSARVEAEKSAFTSLPGVSRKIMVLEGKIEIRHENHSGKTLGKFDQDAFEGDWETSSVGKCTDFNLMTTNNAKGELQALKLAQNQDFDLATEKNQDFVFAYLFTGKIRVHADPENHILKPGDLLLIPLHSDIRFHAEENSELIITRIMLPAAENQVL